jgi:hypothetical protein
MNNWIPLKLISELVIQLISSYEIGLNGYNQLCREFLLARVMISKTVDDSVEDNLNEVIDILKPMNTECFRKV